MMRTLLVTLLLGLHLAGSALARSGYDRAPAEGGIPELVVLGFSEDGAYFAYELYGYDEYTEAAFSRIAILDTETSELVGGDAIGRFIRLEEYAPRSGGEDIPVDEFFILRGAALVAVRYEAAVEAAPVLLSLGFEAGGDIVGRYLIANTISEIATAAEFVLYPVYPLAANGVMLSLRDFRLPSPAHCLEVDQGYAAVELVLTDLDGDELVVYRDGTLAPYRGCPWRYTISDVIIFDAANDADSVVVVLLSSFQLALEGLDRRIAAMAFTLPDGARLVR